MGFFTSKTRVVDLKRGNTVTLRTPTFGDVYETRSTLSGAGKTVDEFALRAEMTVKAIVSWDGPDFEGQPVTRENFMLLPLDVTNKLMEESASMIWLGDDEEKN